MQNMIPNRKEKGFTLIELVMVIVILGILAAFALPRFADLGQDARKATLEGARASLKSANAMARASCLAADSDSCDVKSGTAADNVVTFESDDVQMVFGYIAATKADIDNAVDLEQRDYVVTDNGAGEAIIADGDEECGFSYTAADADGFKPDYGDISCPAPTATGSNT